MKSVERSTRCEHAPPNPSSTPEYGRDAGPAKAYLLTVLEFAQALGGLAQHLWTCRLAPSLTGQRERDSVMAAARSRNSAGRRMTRPGVVCCAGQ